MTIPDGNIAEITLIGTGGGYGESCVIHAGNGEWIVVDSCINPNTGESLPLEHLATLGVDVSSQVKLIICTHWHDDHIVGLSKLLSICDKARLCIPAVKDKKKFLYFVSLDYTKYTRGRISNCSTIEFNQCIDIIKNRKDTVINAIKDRPIYVGENSSIIALSPSDFVFENYEKEISSLITEFGGSTMKITNQSPNSTSIALFIKLGSHRALLGSDLEVSDEDNSGWNDILNNNNTIDKKSSLFKIPHHGSKTGYHPNIWLELLETNPIAKLTPWNRNGKLPEPEMLKEFSKYSDNIFMTSPVHNDKPKKRNKSTEKIIQNLKKKVAEVRYSKGIITSRIDIDDSSKKWEVDYQPSAFHVNPLL